MRCNRLIGRTKTESKTGFAYPIMRIPAPVYAQIGTPLCVTWYPLMRGQIELSTGFSTPTARSNWGSVADDSRQKGSGEAMAVGVPVYANQ